MSGLRLFATPFCPYAQRALAVLQRTGLPCAVVPVDLDDRPEEILALSPTGKVPLLVHPDGILFESDLVAGWLAEAGGWEDALPAAPFPRARLLLLMRRWDAVVAPAFFASLRAGASWEPGAALERELDLLAEIAGSQPEASRGLAGLHCATHWLRMGWLREESGLVARIEARPALRAWLDRAAAAEVVAATAPPRDEAVERLRRRLQGAGR